MYIPPDTDEGPDGDGEYTPVQKNKGTWSGEVSLPGLPGQPHRECGIPYLLYNFPESGNFCRLPVLNAIFRELL